MTLLQRRLLPLLLVLAGAVTIYLSLRLTVEYFDVYTIYLNARALALGDGQDYNWTRAPMLSVLWSPVYHLLAAESASAAVWKISHIAAGFFYVLWLWISYRIFRLCGPRGLALLGSFLFAVNPLVIHYAPFARDDVPAAVLTAAGFFFYLRDCLKSKARLVLWSALCFAGAMSVRHVVILPILLTVGLHEVLRLRFKGRRWSESMRGLMRPSFLMGLTLTFFFAVMTVVYQRVQLASGFDAPGKVLAGIAQYYELNQAKRESSQETVYFILQSMTWPLFAACLAGLWKALRSKQPALRVMVLWLVSFLFFYSVITTNKEARYLFTLFTPLYYFAAAGLYNLFQVFQRRWQPVIAKTVGGLLALFFIALPLQSATAAYARFWNPLYGSDYARTLSREIAVMTGKENRVFWAGRLYALHDRKPVFHPDDEYTYLYHVFGHTLMFYMDHRVDVFPQARFFRAVDPETGKDWAMAVGLGIRLEDRDILVMNLEPGSYNVRNLPAHLSPLLAVRVRLLTYDRDGGNAAEPDTYLSADDSQTRLTVHAEAGAGPILSGEGFAPGFYEVYFQSPEGKRVWQGIAHSGQRGLRFRLSADALKNPARIFLLTYDEVRQYPHPD